VLLSLSIEKDERGEKMNKSVISSADDYQTVCPACRPKSKSKEARIVLMVFNEAIDSLLIVCGIAK
jgi:hypothetical protein